MAEGNNTSGLAAKVDKKRKRQAEQPSKEEPKAGADPSPANNASEGPSKRQKMRAKLKQKHKAKAALEVDVTQQERKDGIDQSIGKMDGRLLADYFVQRAKKLNKELTAMELEDLSVPGM